MERDDRRLVFDVMGTIVREPFVDVVPRSLGMSLETLIAQKDPAAWLAFERGQIDEQAFERHFFTDRRGYDHAGMRAAMTEAYAYLEGMEELLGELRAAGHSLHLMSNYPVWYRLIEQRLGLSRYAAWTFVSCLVGFRKPEEEAYRWLMETLACSASALIFVDDREDNCTAARALGIDAICYRDAAHLRRELSARGLLALEGA